MKLWIEFKASVGEDGEDTEDDIKQAFKDYDTNGDGYITKEEMMQVHIAFFYEKKIVKLKLIFRVTVKYSNDQTNVSHFCLVIKYQGCQICLLSLVC